MPHPRDELAEKALDAVKQRYSPPPPASVQGEDFRAPKENEGWEVKINPVVALQMEEEVARICGPHPPNQNKRLRRALWTRAVKECMKALAVICPKTEERAIAVSRLREALMWGDAAITCNPESDAKEAEESTSSSDQ